MSFVAATRPSTTPAQSPHPVLARVAAATSATVVHPPRTASRMRPADTLLHVQTRSVSASSSGRFAADAAPPPASALTRSSAGSSGTGSERV